MKKLLLIFFLFFAAKSFAQYPLVQGLGNDSTLIKVGQNYKGGIKGGLINMTVADTTAANLLRIKVYPGAMIFTTSDGNFWVRNYLATGWVLTGGGTSPSGTFWRVGGNLFPVTTPTRDIGTLAPYGGAIGLMTNSVVHAIVPDAGFTLSNDTTSTKIFTINPTTKEWGYANWNNGGGGGGGSAWLLTGNTGTSPSTHWLGTNDSTGFRIKVNGKNAGYILQGGFNSGGGISYSRQFTSFGMLSGNKLIDDVIAGISDGGLNMLLGPGAGMNIGNTYDTTAGSPSNQNLIITNVGAGPYIQQNSFVTGNGRNVLIGESACHSCLTPGENTGVGMFVMENGYRPTKNAVFGSSALRSANDASYMTSIGAYASHLTGCSISGVTITNGGSGYTTATVTFSAPLNWGSPGSCYATATGTAVISGGAIVSITITDPGCGYSTLTGTYPNGGRTEKPIITITGDGTGFVGEPIVSCGDNTTSVGHASGWLMKAPKYQIYIGSGSEPTAAYFDQYGGAIGTGAGRHSSVSTLTTLSNAWAIGTNAKVSTNRTLTIGAPAGDTTLRVVINNHTGKDSALNVYEGGVYVDGGINAPNLPTGVQAKRLMLASNGSIYMADTLANPVTGSSSGYTSTKNYFPKFTGATSIGDSRMIEIVNGGGTGNYISIDDAQTGATTTNNFLFNVANSFAGDGSGSQTPLIFFASRASSVLDINLLQLSAASASTGSVIKYTLGRNMATRNMFYSAFNYISNGSSSNFFDESFYGVSGIRRSYASGNTTFGVLADNGYKVEIGGKARITDSLHVGVVGTTTGTLNLGGSTSGLVTIKPANAAGTYTLTLPTTDGASGEFLQTDGSGVLTWAAASGGTPAGNFGNVQLNRNGAFATPGSDSLDYENSTGLKSLAGFTAPGAGSGSERFGAGAVAAGANGVAVGNGASAGGTNSAALGQNASAAGASSFALGSASSASQSSATAIGVSATASGVNSTSIGSSSTASGTYALAIGQSTSAGHTGSIAIGQSSATTATGQLVIGSSPAPIANVFFDKGVTDASPGGVTINASGGSGTNIAGGTLTLAGGKATGNAAGGNINFQTSTVGSSGTTLQTLATRLTISPNSATYATRVLQAQGADVASANNLSLGADGNTFEITGTTQINLISNTNWQNGSEITLLFSGTPTVKNNFGTSGSNINIILAGGADFVATANDVLKLQLVEIGGTAMWIEVGRSVN